MYLFVVTYNNMINGEERKIPIEIEEQFFDNEKDIYLHAMNMAYEKKTDNEILGNIEFLAC